MVIVMVILEIIGFSRFFPSKFRRLALGVMMKMVKNKLRYYRHSFYCDENGFTEQDYGSFIYKKEKAHKDRMDSAGDNYCGHCDVLNVPSETEFASYRQLNDRMAKINRELTLCGQ